MSADAVSCRLKQEDIEAYLEAARALPWEQTDGAGSEFRASSGGRHGSVLVSDAQLIHLSVVGA